MPQSALRVLGLDPLELEVYRALLGGPVGTGREVAARLGLLPGDVTAAVRRLAGHHLVEPAEPATRAPAGSEADRRWRAREPGHALGELVQARRAQVDAAERLVGSLAALHGEATRARRNETTARSEYVRTPHGCTTRLVELLAAARHEVRRIDQPPYPADQVDTVAPALLEVLERGVPVRAVYTREALEAPGATRLARTAAERGEHGHVTDSAPFALVVVDAATVFAPLDHDGRQVTAALVCTGPVVCGPAALFDWVWHRSRHLHGEQATTGGFTDPVGVCRMGDELTPAETVLLGLLASGVKDDTIARTLGVSTRTVERRLTAVARKLGAATRFQLAAEAGRRGLI